MIRTVLFDFDGTIFDTGEGITKSVLYALNKLGIDERLEDLFVFCGPPLVTMFKERYSFDDETADLAVSYFRERYSPIGWKECKPYPGIAELIRTLRERNKEIIVATSKPTHFANQIIEEYGMKSLFDLVVGSSFNGDRTTKSEVIQEAMRLSSHSAKEMIMVGDRKYDVIGAHSLGIPCIGVRYGFSEVNELENACCDFIVDEPKDILDIIP